jgi:hypothetical protein
MSYLNWLAARERPTELAPAVLRASDKLVTAIRAGSHQVDVPNGFFAGLTITVFREGVLPPGCLGVILSPAEHEKMFMIMDTTAQPPNAEEVHLPPLLPRP